MNVGVSYRLSGFSREAVDNILADFLAQIARPESASST
jgi:hypothetical protein